MEQYNKEKKEQNETEGKNDRKKETSVIILKDSTVMHINIWEIPKR